MKGKTAVLRGTLLALTLLVAWGQASAMSTSSTNLVDLLRESTAIVHAKVADVTQGRDNNGLPYTEVTIEISRTLRGSLPATYTFRQFGVQSDGIAESGRVPIGGTMNFPRFVVGEDTLLFLYRSASATGFRTTTGLGHGKFELTAGRAENPLGNVGMFSDISIAPGFTITENDQRILATPGAVNQNDLLSLVDRAVSGRWIEKGSMYKTSEGAPKFPNGGNGGGRKVEIPQ